MNEQTFPETVPAEAVRDSLDGCLRTAAFRRSPKLAAFLSYIVGEELAGRGETIKAYTIATQALGRSDSFDPGSDPSVRVEAGRLRRVLDEVYGDEGRRLPVRIQVPVGAYRPSFEAQVGPDHVAPDQIETDQVEPDRSADGPSRTRSPLPVAVSAPAATVLGDASPQILALFETRGQAVLALLLAVIAFLLATEIALQIYMLAYV